MFLREWLEFPGADRGISDVLPNGLLHRHAIR